MLWVVALVPWPQVAGVVLREWRAGDEGKRRRAVGIAMRTQDMPIGAVQLSPQDLDKRVDALRPLKDWHVDERALQSAVAAVAPGVPALRRDRG